MGNTTRHYFLIKPLVLALIIMLILIVTIAGYRYYRLEEQALRQKKGSELKAIAEIKIKQISEWYEDELKDTALISKNPFLVRAIQEYLDSKGDIKKGSVLLESIRQIRLEHGYDEIILSSLSGSVIFSTNNKPTMDHVVLSNIRLSSEKMETVSTDIYRCNVHDELHLDLISTVVGDNGKLLATMVFRINPKDFLYPILEFWPASSRTSEAYIARKEGDKIVILNGLRHNAEPPLSHIYSINDNKYDFVKAAQGYNGLVDALDYRGVNVLAYVSPVPGTPWFMAAKVDRDEFYGDFYYQTGTVVTISLLLTLLMGMGISYIYRLRSEEALKQSEAFYRNLFENHSAVKLTVDPDTGKILDANEAAAAFYGWSRQQLRQMRIQDINMLSEEEIRDAIEKVKNQQRLHFEFRHKRADGSIRDVDVYSSRLINADGKEILHSIIHDITDRKRAETDLAESEGRYRTLADSTSTAIFIYQAEKFVYVNRASLILSGYSQEELLNMKFWDIVHPDFREMIMERGLARQRGESVPSRYEFKIIRKDGSERWVDFTAGYIVWKGTAAAIGTAFDITEQRRIETQLRHAQRLEAIGQLAGGIAHDFNNVLNAVIGYAGLIQMQMNSADPLRRYVDEIMAAGQRGAALTQQILAFSRKQVLDVKPVDLNNIIKSLDKMIHRLVREDISITMDLSSRALTVSADSSQIGQVVINLVTNAQDAITGPGTIRISTELFVMDENYVTLHGYGVEGEYALLIVSDSGCGMDVATMAHIFEPFFTTKEVGKGTGLGLAVAHGIVKQHNGYINVYSEPGKGSIFRIYLPLSRQTEELVEAESSGPITGGDETILLAEDDPSLRRLSKVLLGQMGYSVIEAVNGEDAVRKFSEKRDSIKLLILDGIMPIKNGREAFDEIRKIRPEIKAIFLSGYAEEIFTHNGIPDSSATFIQKPVNPKDLFRIIRKTLDT